MNMVNYGIIGCGMMAREHIQNINLLPQGRVTVVYDPVAELAHSAAVLAGKDGAAAPAAVADSLQDLLAFEELDAVVIVSPNYLHADQLRTIVATRPIPILCEKPLYTDPSDRAALDALFKGYPHPVWVAMEYRYMRRVPDIWDNGYVIIDFDSGARAMLELCMFAEGSQYQEEISAVGPKGKIECLVPGPGRFWPEKLGPAPVPQLILSPRAPKGPIKMDIPVDPTLLEAGDHNGSTFYQHQRFNAVVRGQGGVEVTLSDGAKAVAIGIAAQESARTGQAVTL